MTGQITETKLRKTTISAILYHFAVEKKIGGRTSNLFSLGDKKSEETLLLTADLFIVGTD